MSASEIIQRLDEPLRTAITLHVPGKWGRDHGIDVPSGDGYQWDAARINLLRQVGLAELANHLTADRLDVLEAIDWSDETTRRADAFRAALAAQADGE